MADCVVEGSNPCIQPNCLGESAASSLYLWGPIAWTVPSTMNVPQPSATPMESVKSPTPMQAQDVLRTGKTSTFVRSIPVMAKVNVWVPTSQMERDVIPAGTSVKSRVVREENAN